MELSQKRALSVAEYCLGDDSKILTDAQLEDLRSVISATGRSYSNPVYDENGEVDMEASRRVEFLFRLKDEEMIREMIEILSAEEN
jgi:chemotaxis protein MotB